MSIIEMVMPKMGESIFEATVIRWLKKEGDKIEKDESIVEVATDKVDTEVPASVSGVLSKIYFKEGDVVKIGMSLAQINVDAKIEKPILVHQEVESIVVSQIQNDIEKLTTSIAKNVQTETINRFYSPLVLNIAKQESISIAELETIVGSGLENRVTKTDILNYINQKRSNNNDNIESKNIKNENHFHDLQSEKTEEPSEKTRIATPEPQKPIFEPVFTPQPTTIHQAKPPQFNGAFEIVEMDRMRKIIANRMLESQRISATVTSWVEVDVTSMVQWRSKIKSEFMKREGEVITFTPVFIEAIAKALKDYPLLNASVDGENIIVKKDINIGIAVALNDGNLIVPVLKHADRYNISGLTKAYNDLIRKTKVGKLSADDLQDGTYTISNIGGFGNVMGTPILVQPQVGIMAMGAILKKPYVVDTDLGESIGIRHILMISHSYDHRIIDGALGGSFAKRVAEYLEKFDVNRKIS